MPTFITPLLRLTIAILKQQMSIIAQLPQKAILILIYVKIPKTKYSCQAIKTTQIVPMAFIKQRAQPKHDAVKQLTGQEPEVFH